MSTFREEALDGSSFRLGALGGSSLVIGALVALRFRIGLRWIGLIMAFGAGALISAVAAIPMLADTMMPEAFEHGGRFVGVVTTLGFMIAFAIHTVE